MTMASGEPIDLATLIAILMMRMITLIQRTPHKTI